MAIGVFGLQTVYKLKKNETYSDLRTYGWVGGGGIPAPVSQFSRVDRINFSNDVSVASVRGPLSSARLFLAATGNSNYGWFAGGNPPAVVSTVDRIDFSNDASTTSVRGPLSLARRGLAATGNSNYGWFGGGQGPSSTVDRMDFSNDSSTASIRGPLSSGRYNLAATGTPNYGYFGGGGPTASTLSTVDRIELSNDLSTASVRGPLSLGRTQIAATGNSNYGWFGGGIVTTGASVTIRVERLDYSNDATLLFTRGFLSQARSQLAATGNSNYGWFGGGITAPAGSTTASRVDRIDYSNDSPITSVRGGLSLLRSASGATSGQGKNSITKLQKTGSYGWFSGGFTTVPVSTVDRIDFSNDVVTASVRGSISPPRYSLASTGNSNYGWFAGGVTPTIVNPTTVDRMDFNNDLYTPVVRGPLTSGKYGLVATGNSNYGWFGGGMGASPINPLDMRSSVDRVDFSNDAFRTSLRGPLSQARYQLAATSNSDYGWFGGGLNAPATASTTSRVDRINFSNDSSTASIRSSLSSARFNVGATGNSNYGWFGGGAVSPTPVTAKTTVDRIDFSNDIIEILIRSPLSSERGQLAATGNSNYGWFGGGGTPANASTVDRIDFSNDAATVSVRGPLSSARSNLAATSNTPVG